MSRDLTHCFAKIPVKPLDEVALSKIRTLEKKLGYQLIAFGKQGSEYANLTVDQQKQIDALGSQIDAVVVAYNSPPPSGRPRPQDIGIDVS
jgi:hypothetical protein